MTTDLLHAIGSWKHDEFVQAQAAILRVALGRDKFGDHFFYPGDIAEDMVPHSRQGVASNAWNALRALNIIDRVSFTVNCEPQGIISGRKRNTNPHAKGSRVRNEPS